MLVDVFRDDKIINSSSDLLDFVSGWTLVSRNLLLLKLKKKTISERFCLLLLSIYSKESSSLLSE